MKQAIPETFQGYPVVTPERMRAVDQKAIAFGIPALELMENAGAGVAKEALAYLKAHGTDNPADALITVCCGRGNNGGDGLVAARHLKAAGAEVMVFIAPAQRDKGYGSEVQENLRRASEAGVSVHQASEELVDLEVKARSSALLIDALLGTGSSGKPAGPAQKMIKVMTRSKKPVIAVDVPSGIDPETGYHHGVFITAAVTCALGLPKTGLLASHAAKNVGELKVIDIGIPKRLWETEK